MKLHGNARTCPKSRELIARRVLEESWSSAAAAAGALFRFAGSVWRSSQASWAHSLAAGLMSGALIGEALLLYPLWRAPRMLAVELALGALLPFALSRGRRAVALTVVFTVVLTLALVARESGVRELLRNAGWRGA
jgi:hypothetical protein